MTLNEKIAKAWEVIRSERPSGGQARRDFDLRMEHVIAKRFDTTVERVRQRITKIENQRAKGLGKWASTG